MKTRTGIHALFLALVSITGCTPSAPTASSSIVEISYPIELGNDKNVLGDRGTLFFVGHRVERFRLKLRFTDPDGQTGAWIPGVTLSLSAGATVQELTALPAGADPDGSFFTQELAASSVLIRIGSAGNLVDFQGGRPRLEIVAVDRRFRPGSSADDLPGPGAVMALDSEAIGFSPGFGEAQHYMILQPGAAPGLESLYVSPRFLGLGLENDVGLKVHVSPTGFVSPGADVQWIEPSPGDSGIYTEMQAVQGQALFVTVVSALPAPYLIRNTRLVERFGSIVLERDEAMGAAPDIDLDAVRGGTGPTAPFNAQIADFLQRSASYDRRIRETMVIASAFSLDATDGQMRFESAELHRDIDAFRDVDVQLGVCDDGADPECRANAGHYHIDMFTADLQDPASAGWTLHHEWGHFEYGLPDEYVDISGGPPPVFSEAIDPNSLMGTRSSTELCTPRNHLWAEDADGEEDSAWTQIADQYPEVSPAPVMFGDLSQGRYMDVLHKLDSMLTLTTY